MSNPLRVLVLDQHEDVRGYLANTLSEQQFDVLNVSTTEDLLSHAAQRTPFAIFIDGDDADLARSVTALKSNPNTANVPTILITSGASTDILIDLWFSHAPPDFTVRRPISTTSPYVSPK